MTRKEALACGEERLIKAGIDEAGLDAWYLFAEVSGITRAQYFLDPEQTLSEECVQKYEAMLAKREKRVPLQYIIGNQEFMGLEFEVSEAVLIPRQDTEILIYEAMKLIRAKKAGAAGLSKAGCSVLDVCTGSGCIIISLAKLAGLGRAAACDISAEALAVAGRNAQRHEADVEFYQGDLFEPITDRYDMIVSNPPYIASGEIEELMPEVREYEPELALDGGKDGLIFYRRLAKEAGAHLTSGGFVLFEIGCEQGAAVSELLLENGYRNIRIIKDYAGLDRVVCAEWE